MSIYDNFYSIDSTGTPTFNGILPRHSTMLEVTSNPEFALACAAAMENGVDLSHKNVDWDKFSL